ncbi:hypothetical protein GCM10028808_10290 [Spirosoma migulaei]
MIDLPNLIESLKEIDFKGLTSEYLLSNIADKGVNGIRQSFRQAKSKLIENLEQYIEHIPELSIVEEVVIKSIINNIKTSISWSKEINLKILPESKELRDIFIEIDLFVSQLRERIEPDDELTKMPSSALLSKIDKNIILYGGPGAGKTTLMMNLFTDLLGRYQANNIFSFPIVIRFRELNYTNVHKDEIYGMYEIISEMLGINFEFYKINNRYITLKQVRIKEKEQIEEQETLFKALRIYREDVASVICEFIDKCNMLIIFDGFDEIPDIKIKNQIEKDLFILSRSLTKSRFIVTSRNGELNINLYNTRTYEISPLTESQILFLAEKWLKKEELVREFVQKIKSSPFYDTAIRPLTLAHLCSIYEVKGYIPAKPRYVYDYIITLLIEKWDIQRAIQRRTDYEELYIERMKEFLAHISFELSYSFRKALFFTSDLIDCYKRVCTRYNLPDDQAEKVAEQIESHNGLLIKVGSMSYQFAHKSLQEYLTAKYIHSLPTYPPSNIIETLPNEMAIVISLSSETTKYLTKLGNYLFDFSLQYWLTFTARLSIEKPDFSERPDSLIFFYNMLQKSYKMKSSREDKGMLIEELKSFVLVIFNSTNIEICFKELLNIYSFKVEGNVVHFQLKDTSPHIYENEYYPSWITTDKEFTFGLFK